ncbi:hypothetical protein ACM614_28240 [Streptomyces sp. 12297]
MAYGHGSVMGGPYGERVVRTKFFGEGADEHGQQLCPVGGGFLQMFRETAA